MKILEPLAGKRQPKESRQAVLACNDYLRMGPGRSLSVLHAQYCTDLHQSAPPTKGLRTLKQWSSEFAWQRRAEQYDSAIEIEKNARLAQERREVMEEGVALDYKRIARLKAIEADLYDQYFEVDDEGRRKNLWLEDFKGKDADVRIERFNAPLVGELRGLYDDIAKEKGERKLRVENSTIAMTFTAEDMAQAQGDTQKFFRERFGELPDVTASIKQHDRESASGEGDDGGND